MHGVGDECSFFSRGPSLWIDEPSRCTWELNGAEDEPKLFARARWFTFMECPELTFTESRRVFVYLNRNSYLHLHLHLHRHQHHRLLRWGPSNRQFMKAVSQLIIRLYFFYQNPRDLRWRWRTAPSSLHLLRRTIFILPLSTPKSPTLINSSSSSSSRIILHRTRSCWISLWVYLTSFGAIFWVETVCLLTGKLIN